MVNLNRLFTIRDNESKTVTSYYKMDYYTVVEYKAFRKITGNALGVVEFVKYSKAHKLPIQVRKIATVSDYLTDFKGIKLVYNNLALLGCPVGFSLN